MNYEQWRGTRKSRRTTNYSYWSWHESRKQRRYR
nr:MAG TPA: hypothetical protein [Caudoviricetes sp.]